MADTTNPEPAIPDDHELALKLHREWNLPQRRSRTVSQAAQAAAQAASKAKALKELSRKRKAHEGSSNSDDDDSPSGSKVPRRKGGRGSSEDGESPVASRRQRGDKASGCKRPSRRPQHVVAAEKAKAQAGMQAGKGSGIAPPESTSHVKCFYAGLRFGAWLPASAMASRATFAAAVQAAFTDDGVSAEAESLHVVVLTDDGQALEFPPATQQRQSGRAAAAGKGSAAAAKTKDKSTAPDTDGKPTVENEQQQGELGPKVAAAATDNEDSQQAGREAAKPEQPPKEQTAVEVSKIEDTGSGEGAAAATAPTAVAEATLAADTGAWDAAAKRAVRIYVR